MTLDQFIEYSKKGGFNHLYIEEPGFSTLYVRYNRRYLRGYLQYPTLDIAVIEAAHPGKGSFTKLCNRLQCEYPDLYIYVECVQNPRFVAKLCKMGFIPVGNECFYLPPKLLKQKKLVEVKPNRLRSNNMKKFQFKNPNIARESMENTSSPPINEEDEKEYDDIMRSEACRSFGIPCKLQIWSDEDTRTPGYGEVEVTNVDHSTVSFNYSFNGRIISMRKIDFCRWFSFKRTVY